MNKHQRPIPPFPTKQSGNVLIVVIFVVVVMGLLAGTMARLEWSNQDTQSREILGTRAWFMAHSANEWALTQMFPLGEDEPDLKGYCSSLNDKDINTELALKFGDNEYSNCHFKDLSCRYTPIKINNDDGTTTTSSFYTIQSRAVCGVPKDNEDNKQYLFEVERVQDVVVREIQK